MLQSTVLCLFQSQKDAQRKQEMEEHHRERKKLRRSAGTLTQAKKRDPRIWGKFGKVKK